MEGAIKKPFVLENLFLFRAQWDAASCGGSKLLLLLLLLLLFVLTARTAKEALKRCL